MGSVSYLLDIANFFVPETAIDVNWGSADGGEGAAAAAAREVTADDDENGEVRHSTQLVIRSTCGLLGKGKDM